MPIPVPVLAAGAALAGYYFFVKKPADAAKAQAAITPGGAAGAAGGTSSAAATGMPADLQAKVNQLLANGQEPDSMDEVAAKCESLGFQTQALQLKLRAAELRAQQAQPASPSAPAYVPPAYTPPSYTPPAAPAYVPPAYVPPAAPAYVPPSGPQYPRSAIVTTNDPAPSGDLKVLSSPGGGQIGGAEKNGQVSVLEPPSGGFVRVSWGGGSRWPAVTGYVKSQYLRDASSGATIAGRAGHNQANLVGRMGGLYDAFGRQFLPGDYIGARAGHNQADLIGAMNYRALISGRAGHSQADLIGAADIVGRTRGYGTAFGARAGHNQADLVGRATGRLGQRHNRNY